jgi:hypothetical protein
MNEVRNKTATPPTTKITCLETEFAICSFPAIADWIIAMPNMHKINTPPNNK